MSQDDPTPFAADAEVVAAEIVTEAVARARAEVLDWLVPKLADAYRREVTKHLAGNRAGPARVGHYLYAITGTDQLRLPVALTGIDDEPVTVIDVGGLSALTSPVDPSLFEPDSDEMAMSGWLAQAVRAHEAVAEHALGRVPVLPMRFGTVYASAAAVAAALEQHRADLLVELKRLGTATEWSVKICLPQQQSADAGDFAGPEVGDPAANGGGTAWMLARQSALLSRQQQPARIAACIDQVRTQMRSHAREEVVAATADRRRSELFNATYLVDEVAPFCETFETLQRQHERTGFELRMTGPWPPYHFVRLSRLRGDGGE